MDELQERQRLPQEAPSAAMVADSAESERLNVTLPAGLMNRLKQHALAERRSCSSLASFLIEDGLRRHCQLDG
ncbi:MULTISPECIES: ribbon-helix-helix domain-containing protein [unclassified Prochlorococcus]|uniref:ribbon-helix-helix domain-containing protein n=1 Tax=unclassified Prochlorococcus TaxID=2627481 RepID=UPI000533A84B|nr:MULTISPECIES: CopG family transcriptional regulator [unclassified Prochlorococcus]KGG24990.1 putative Helix-turn-helix protein [Prochlorococcus sp. MIT 0701]KGG26142.1 putative Helix-turn-helix protein [Prochlorococcus sp. MIT 0702]KGG32966.1 putative Helix-turn-helix protein [Prochlorococcus sp. MIT 0703]HJN33638.1 CopG family transcriptional regulator [Prochlorococcus sp.]